MKKLVPQRFLIKREPTWGDDTPRAFSKDFDILHTQQGVRQSNTDDSQIYKPKGVINDATLNLGLKKQREPH